MSNHKPSLIAPVSGVVMGIGVFLGVNFTIGRANIPTVESVKSASWDLSEPKYPVTEVVATGPVGGAYQTTCQTCHQAEGQGVPGAFPPLAGSEWLNGDPETPIRIVLMGLSGPIEVKGQKFNGVMPPPAGLTDEQIAEAISHARTSFGNTASKVDAELVKQVRAGLAGRTQMWTADELAAVRAVPPTGGDVAAPGAAAPAGAAADAPAPSQPSGAAPAPAVPTPAVPAVKGE